MIIKQIGEKEMWGFNGAYPVSYLVPLYACYYKGKIGVGRSVAEAITNSL